MIPTLPRRACLRCARRAANFEDAVAKADRLINLFGAGHTSGARLAPRLAELGWRSACVTAAAPQHAEALRPCAAFPLPAQCCTPTR